MIFKGLLCSLGCSFIYPYVCELVCTPDSLLFLQTHCFAYCRFRLNLIYIPTNYTAQICAMHIDAKQIELLFILLKERLFTYASDLLWLFGKSVYVQFSSTACLLPGSPTRCISQTIIIERVIESLSIITVLPMNPETFFYQQIVFIYIKKKLFAKCMSSRTFLYRFKNVVFYSWIM